MVSHTRVKGEGGVECEFVLCEYASWCAAPSVRLRADALCGVSGRGARRGGAQGNITKRLSESRARLGLAVSRRLAERFQISRFAKRLCAKGIGKY